MHPSILLRVNKGAENLPRKMQLDDFSVSTACIDLDFTVLRKRLSALNHALRHAGVVLRHELGKSFRMSITTGIFRRRAPGSSPASSDVPHSRTEPFEKVSRFVCSRQQTLPCHIRCPAFPE